MKRVSQIPRLLALAAALILPEIPLKADPAPEPFSKDEASGKTVMSHMEGYQIVLSRFYNAPVIGSEAPELVLFDPELEREVELEELIGEKPVVLLFGSYGCDVLYDHVEGVRSCLEDFGDRADFHFVYIREAHSEESNEESEEPKLTPVIADPKLIEERRVAAKKWMEEQGLSFRILIDSMEDRASTRWAGWPVRIYAVGEGRKVLYSGKPGPWGFYPAPEEKADGFDRMRPHEDRFSQESLYEFLQTHFEGGDSAGE